jgi:hypothetical protein
LTLTVEVGELPAVPEHDGDGVAAGLPVFLCWIGLAVLAETRPVVTAARSLVEPELGESLGAVSPLPTSGLLLVPPGAVLPEESDGVGVGLVDVEVDELGDGDELWLGGGVELLDGCGVIVGFFVAHVVWFVAPEVGLCPGDVRDPPVVSDWPGAAPVA